MRCILVLPERFELSASPLPRECSTPELRQRETNVGSIPERTFIWPGQIWVYEARRHCHNTPGGASGGREGRASEDINLERQW